MEWAVGVVRLGGIFFCFHVGWWGGSGCFDWIPGCRRLERFLCREGRVIEGMEGGRIEGYQHAGSDTDTGVCNDREI